MDPNVLLVTSICSINLLLIIEKYRQQKLEKNKKLKTRRFWVRPLFKMRKEVGFYAGIYPHLTNDPEMFLHYTRMEPETFHKLLRLVGPSITKLSKREPLCLEERLLITLRYHIVLTIFHVTLSL